MQVSKGPFAWSKAFIRVTGILTFSSLMTGCATGTVTPPAAVTHPAATVAQITETQYLASLPTPLPSQTPTAQVVETQNLASLPTVTPTPQPLPSDQEIASEYKNAVKPTADLLMAAKEDTSIAINPEAPILYVPADERLFTVQAYLNAPWPAQGKAGQAVYILYNYTRGRDLGYDQGYSLYISAETQEIITDLRLVAADGTKVSLVERVKATGSEGSTSLANLVENAVQPFTKLSPDAAAGVKHALEQIIGYACGIDMAPGLDYAHRAALLTQAIKANNWAERRQAAQALGALTPLPVSAAPDLIPLLANNSSMDIYAAEQTLGKMASDPGVRDLLVKALKDQNAYTRQHAATALRNLDPPPAALLEPFLALLHDPDVMVRQEARSWLEVYVEPDAVPPLIADLADKTPEVRQVAAEILQNYGAQAAAAVTGLTGLLKDASGDVRAAAARALGAIGEPAKSALAELARAASSETNTDAFDGELSAIAALSSQPDALPVLRQALKSNSSQIRMEACAVLGGYTGVPGAIDLLMLAVKDSDSYVRRNAYWALGELGGEAASVLPTLTQIAQKTSDYQEYENVLGAIGEIGGKANALPLLQQALTSGQPPVRRAACNVLSGYQGVPGADEVLRIAVKDTDDTVRQCAAAALGSTSSSQPSANLDQLAQAALKETDPSLFYDEIRSMTELYGKPAALPTLSQALKGSGPKIRAMVCSILEQYVGIDGAVEALIPAISVAEASVRQAAATALQKFGSEAAGALAGLKAAAGSESNAQALEAQLEAVAAIAGPDEAYPLIQAALKRSTSELRGAATAALKTCKSVAGAIDLLISLVHDSDERVRVNAVDSIGSFGADGKKALPDLEAALSNPKDYYVYLGAATALGNIGPEAGPAAPALMSMIQKAGDLEKVYPLVALGQIGPAARAAVPGLMDFLNNIPKGNWTDELRKDCLKSLGQITLNDFGTDIQKWNDWWKTVKGNW